MADYNEKRTVTLERIVQLEQDIARFTDAPEKQARAKQKLETTKELVGRIETKMTNGQPPKAAKAAKAATTTKRGKRSAKK